MRKLAWFAFSFSLAAAVFAYLIPTHFLLPAAAVCGAGAGAILITRSKKRQVFLALIGLAAGFLWCFAYYQLFYCPAEELEGSTCRVQAYVTDYPEEMSYGTRLSLRVINTDGGPGISTRLYAYGGDSPELDSFIPGDKIEFTAEFSLA
ncbi:MAG: DUF4131 domain-containing protein, partial [Oscillospiraceae bacterium]|nr:DUF4131 domain-containing protein [Oscillospiraceae bacterium]